MPELRNGTGLNSLSKLKIMGCKGGCGGGKVTAQKTSASGLVGKTVVTSDGKLEFKEQNGKVYAVKVG